MHSRVRSIDSDPVARWWEKGQPYVHVAGVLLLAAFTIGTYSSKFDAHAEDIKNNKSHIREIDVVIADHEKQLFALREQEAITDQKLDDMIFFFHIPKHAKRP